MVFSRYSLMFVKISMLIFDEYFYIDFVQPCAYATTLRQRRCRTQHIRHSRPLLEGRIFIPRSGTPIIRTMEVFCDDRKRRLDTGNHIRFRCVWADTILSNSQRSPTRQSENITDLQNKTNL